MCWNTRAAQPEIVGRGFLMLKDTLQAILSVVRSSGAGFLRMLPLSCGTYLAICRLMWRQCLSAPLSLSGCAGGCVRAAVLHLL